jgi:hypothetical protein
LSFETRGATAGNEDRKKGDEQGKPGAEEGRLRRKEKEYCRERVLVEGRMRVCMGSISYQAGINELSFT